MKTHVQILNDFIFLLSGSHISEHKESFWRKFLVNNDDVIEEIDKKNCPQLGLLKRDEFEVT